MHGNERGMSIVISHPDGYTIEERISLFVKVGFDTLFLSCGVTKDFDSIPLWADLAREEGIALKAAHAPSGLLGYAGRLV